MWGDPRLLVLKGYKREQKTYGRRLTPKTRRGETDNRVIGTVITNKVEKGAKPEVSRPGKDYHMGVGCFVRGGSDQTERAF